MRGESIRKIQICGGDCRVSGGADDVFCTVLGSCVTVCIHDPIAGVGGMNHYLLPRNRNEKPNARYGDDAMAGLLDHLEAAGAVRHRLRAKIYGGARMIEGDGDIGYANSDFAFEFLRKCHVAVESWDVGGSLARWVYFYPASGQSDVRVAGQRLPDRTSLRARDMLAVIS